MNKLSLKRPIWVHVVSSIYVAIAALVMGFGWMFYPSFFFLGLFLLGCALLLFVGLSFWHGKRWSAVVTVLVGMGPGLYMADSGAIRFELVAALLLLGLSGLVAWRTDFFKQDNKMQIGWKVPLGVVITFFILSLIFHFLIWN